MHSWVKKDEINEQKARKGSECKREGLCKVDGSMTRSVVMKESMSLGEELHMHMQADRELDREVLGEAGQEQPEGRERGK